MWRVAKLRQDVELNRAGQKGFRLSGAAKAKKEV